VFARTRAQNRQKLQALLLVVIGLGLVALAVTVPGLLYL
jgi:hypothetical protein